MFITNVYVVQRSRKHTNSTYITIACFFTICVLKQVEKNGKIQNCGAINLKGKKCKKDNTIYAFQFSVKWVDSIFSFYKRKRKRQQQTGFPQKNQALHSVYSKNLKKCSFGIVGQNLLAIYSSWVDLAENFISKDKILQLLPRFQSKISEGKFSDVMIAPKKTLFFKQSNDDFGL